MLGGRVRLLCCWRVALLERDGRQSMRLGLVLRPRAPLLDPRRGGHPLRDRVVRRVLAVEAARLSVEHLGPVPRAGRARVVRAEAARLGHSNRAAVSSRALARPLFAMYTSKLFATRDGDTGTLSATR